MLSFRALLTEWARSSCLLTSFFLVSPTGMTLDPDGNAAAPAPTGTQNPEAVTAETGSTETTTEGGGNDSMLDDAQHGLDGGGEGDDDRGTASSLSSSSGGESPRGDHADEDLEGDAPTTSSRNRSDRGGTEDGASAQGLSAREKDENRARQGREKVREEENAKRRRRFKGRQLWWNDASTAEAVAVFQKILVLFYIHISVGLPPRFPCSPSRLALPLAFSFSLGSASCTVTFGFAFIRCTRSFVPQSWHAPDVFFAFTLAICCAMQSKVAKLGIALCNGLEGSDPNRGADRAAAADQSKTYLGGVIAVW